VCRRAGVFCAWNSLDAVSVAKLHSRNAGNFLRAGIHAKQIHSASFGLRDEKISLTLGRRGLLNMHHERVLQGMSKTCSHSTQVVQQASVPLCGRKAKRGKKVACSFGTLDVVASILILYFMTTFPESPNTRLNRSLIALFQTFLLCPLACSV
jgi:hypothetical protein